MAVEEKTFFHRVKGEDETFTRLSDLGKKKKRSDLITIRGIVVPADWDERGIVISINIATFDEEEYFIERNDVAEELFMRLGQGVEVTGHFQDVNGKKILKVIRVNKEEIRSEGIE
jgi:hypothetical protein